MLFGLNWLSAYWGLLAMLFSSGIVTVLIVKDILEAKRNADLNTAEQTASLGTNQIIPLSVLKATTRKHVSKIGLLVFGVLLGYLGRDLEVKANYAKQFSQWQHDQKLWEAKYLPVLQERK